MADETITLARCPRCTKERRIGSYRRQFCTCGWTKDRDPLPEKAMCCAECEKPLAVTKPLGGFYCTHCNYAPSMQDIVLVLRTSKT